MKSTNQPLILSLAIVALFATITCATIGIAWLGQSFSNQELLANYAHVLDFFKGLTLSGPWPWWTPMFLGGTSLAPFWGSVGSALWMGFFVSIFGNFSGIKLAALTAYGLGGFAQFRFVRAVTRSAPIAACAAIAYLLLPSQWIRLGAVEHLVVTISFACLPLAFWSVYTFIQRPSTGYAVMAAAACGLLVLSYSKTAALAFPALIFFALASMDRTQGCRLPSLRQLAIFALCFFLLAILPGLPGLREWRNFILFDLSPFADWQKAFSTKSAVLWFESTDWLTSGMPPFINYAVVRGAQYLGIACILIFASLFLFRRALLYQSPTGARCRLFLGLTLLQHWLSFGSYSVITGQLAFLEASSGAPLWTPAISWLVLALQAWLCFLILPLSLPSRKIVGTVLILIYFFIPGFQLLSWLPMYSTIRAPFDFYQIIGVFFLSIATGIATWMLLAEIRRPLLRVAIIIVILAIAIWDIQPYFKPFQQSLISQQTVSDFNDVSTFLKKTPLQGRIYALSGRYFYLLLPSQTGRPLINEAFQSYMMQRDMAYLQHVALQSSPDLLTVLRLSGVSHIFVDKNDPDVQPQVRTRFKSIFPTVYSNDSFDILENPTTLYPGFLAKDYVQVEGNGLVTANASARLAQYGFASIYRPSEAPALDRLSGTIDSTGVHLKPGAETRTTSPFQKVPNPSIGLTKTFNKTTLTANTGNTWLTFSQAYHPDWTATYQGIKLPIYRAFEGLMAVRVPEAGGEITFEFQPPLWYNLSIYGFVAAWATLILGLFILPLLPANLRRRLFPKSILHSAPLRLDKSALRLMIEKPLVIIPTYNEIESIQETLDTALQQDDALHILVVDDGSSDGTAECIKNHDQYQKRVFLLQRPGKLGLGSAYKDGFQWARESNYDCVIEMDADLSHNPTDIPRLLEELNNGKDVAIGSRYLGGVRVLNWPQHRLFLSTSASRYTQFLTRLPLTDPTSGFKAIRMEALDALDWHRFRAEGYGFQIELHYYLWRANALLIEVPIIFTERRKGSTKMSLRIAIEAAIRVFLLGLEGMLHE